MSLVYLVQVMGTSVREIEDTYARWLKRTDEHLRALLEEGTTSGPPRVDDARVLQAH